MKFSSIDFRFATKEDLNKLEILVNSAYRGESSKKGWTTEADLLGGIRVNQKILEETLTKPGSYLLVFQPLESEILGVVNLIIKKQHIYLGMLTVNPELQNSGIGGKLLTEAEDFAKFHNKNFIRMTAISARTELIAYYERKAYVLTGEKEPFPMNDPDFGDPKQFLEFVVLEKEIK